MKRTFVHVSLKSLKHDLRVLQNTRFKIKKKRVDSFYVKTFLSISRNLCSLYLLNL